MFKLFKFLKKNILEIVVILVLLIAQVWLQLMLPDQMGQMNGIIAGSNNSGTGAFANASPFDVEYVKIFFGLFETSYKTAEILRNSGIMLLTALGIFAIAIVVGLMLTNTAAILGKRIRTAMYEKVNSLSLSQYDNFGTASLITRTTNDVEQVKNTYYMGLRIMVVSPLTLIIGIIRTIMVSSDLVWVLLISVPTLIILIVILLLIAYPKFNRLQIIIDKITSVFRSQLKGVRVIRAFIRQEEETQAFLRANDESLKINLRIGRLFSIGFPLINIVFNMSYLLIYVVGFHFIGGKPITGIALEISNILVVSQYVMQILMAFLMFAMVLINVPRALASSKRINEVLNVVNLVKDPQEPHNDFIKEKIGTIEFRNVTFTFPNATEPTIKDISFACRPGTITAIIGSTGSGKSTIINLIPRFHDVTSGEVLVNGIDVKEISQTVLRNQIGFIPQKPLLFSGTIKSNLRFGKEDATEDEMVEALKVAQAKNFVFRKEGQLEAAVAQGGNNFSGGQKQRLSIARALVRKAPIYIFDDAFSALDFKTDAALRMALREYAKDSSVIIVAQRVSTITNADSIIVLNNGEISGIGTHDELLKQNKVYQEIVESQS
ncbi:MAG: ABC transporter ATP-binding protein/permease [Erysipelotrichaceae bacterium]|jgi:ATP-binding cassette subfamily B protein|nr:ABC transporter ATP-binding protein/permease [Erysipelotrichaceae bacterium]